MRRAARPDERVQHTLLHANRGALPTNAPTERSVCALLAADMEETLALNVTATTAADGGTGDSDDSV